MNHKTFDRSTAFFVAVLLAVVWPVALRAQMKAPDTQAAFWYSGDKAERDFKKAHQDFLKKNRKAAAEEIRKAAALLKREQDHAAIEGKKDISDSARRLEKLASEVDAGAVTSVKELDHAFARAHYALARDYYLKASESWTEKETQKAGHNLKSAASGLEHGLAWAGQKTETGSKTVIKGARTLGDKLIKGAGRATGEVDKGIQDLGKEIEKFGEKTESEKK